MDVVQVMTSGLITIFLYALICAAVYKLFSIANELGEIKELLKEMQRANDQAVSPIPRTGAPAEKPEIVYDMEVLDKEAADKS